MQQARTPNIAATPERAMVSLRVVAPALIIPRGMNHAPLIEWEAMPSFFLAADQLFTEILPDL
jgi:hypothetical protein